MAKVYRSPGCSGNNTRRKRYRNEIPRIKSFAPPDKKPIAKRPQKTRQK